MKFQVVQDGDVFENSMTREEAASYIEDIADSLRGDAIKFEHMAKAVRDNDDPTGSSGWKHSGSYLELEVEPDGA